MGIVCDCLPSPRLQSGDKSAPLVVNLEWPYNPEALSLETCTCWLGSSLTEWAGEIPQTMKLGARLTRTGISKAAILIRVMVGGVFLSEGIQKFLFAAEVGAGRFGKIGLPNPELLGPLVGGFEIACGTLVLLGLFTRLAVLPLLTIMVVAILSTKIPILVESGFWRMAHAARTDFSMTLGSLFLLITGSGPWSLDAWVNQRRPKGHGQT